MNILKLLNGSELTAKFQYLCGVRWTAADSDKPIYPRESDHDKKYTVSKRILYWMATAGSELAGEPFYYVFFPACSWLFDLGIARRSLLFISASMFLGQSLKDVLKLPRPASPPVIRLEATYETEYGMPSTHTIAAFAVSFSLFMFTSHVYEIDFAKGMAAASLWSLTVMISRVYLGMHSLMDIFAGVAVVSGLLKVLPPVIYWFEAVQLGESNLPSFIFAAVVVFCSWMMFHIDNEVEIGTGKRRWNTARGDTAEILGWCFGFLLGSRYIIINGILGNASTTLRHFTVFSYRQLLRYMAGSVILGPTTLLFRKSVFHIFVYLNGCQSLDKATAKKQVWVEFPYKFLTTMFSGFISTTVVPQLLQYFNIW